MMKPSLLNILHQNDCLSCACMCDMAGKWPPGTLAMHLLPQRCYICVTKQTVDCDTLCVSSLECMHAFSCDGFFMWG